MTLILKPRNTRRPSLRQRVADWSRGPTMARDIAVVLAIKLTLLMTLKYAFFNHPQAEHMSLPPEQVAQALLSIPASHPSQGDHHAR